MDGRRTDGGEDRRTQFGSLSLPFTSVGSTKMIEKMMDYCYGFEALWFSGLCSWLVIRGSWVRIPLGAYMPLDKAVCPQLGAFTLLTSRFLKSRHFDPTIYTCAKNREVSVSRNVAIFWLVVRMCDHRLQCMHSCMQSMQYAWGPRISIHVSKSARS